MREILFRGKATNRNPNEFYRTSYKNGDWVYGFLSDSKNYLGFAEMINTDGICGIDVDPETVGQYTGLTDKNGKKIFEGDILKQKTTPEFAKVNSFKWEHYGIVRFGYYDWDEGEAGYASIGWYIEPLKSVSIKPKKYLVGHIQAGLNQCDILNKYHPMEVIGNIHDNPELLKGGAEE